MSKWRLGRTPAERIRKVEFVETIREKVLSGINQLAEVVGITLGPNGKNVIIKVNMGNVFTKDGVTVAKHVDFEDYYESLGADIIKEAAKKTCDDVGDGTTLSTILANAIINYGLEEIKKGKRVDDLARQVAVDVQKVITHLEEQAVKITDNKQTVDIATISANNKELGELIGGIYNKIGEEGVIITEDSGTTETFSEEVEGLRFESGLINQYFITNYERQRCELENPFIFISDLELTSFAPFVQLLSKIKLESNNVLNLLIVANKISGEALNGFLLNHIKGIFKIACVEAPYLNEDRKQFLDDLALVTGGKFVSRDLNLKIADLTVADFGRAEKVIASLKNTIVVGGKGKSEDINNRILILEEEKKTVQDKHDFDLRLSRLKNKISILKVGASTKSELKEKKYRIEDAVEATKVALKGGIVVGGEIALINSSSDLEDGTIKKSCFEPFRTLLKNIDREKEFKEIVERVGGSTGFNALTEKVEDLFTNGIIDPVLVPITALKNASSVAINFLKSGGLVLNIKDLDEPVSSDTPLTIE